MDTADSATRIVDDPESTDGTGSNASTTAPRHGLEPASEDLAPAPGRRGLPDPQIVAVDQLHHEVDLAGLLADGLVAQVGPETYSLP